MVLNQLPALDTFANRVAGWQKKAGRHHLPWQATRDPYRIWLSEIMLQQTQVATVLPYYSRFLERFPCVHALAQASQDDVMPYWAGLGYYARARNLHRCAQQLIQYWGGKFPEKIDDIEQLPGIGRSTAAAIAAFAYGQRTPIMDGNVKRVFTRYFGIYGPPSQRAVETILWQTADAVVSAAPQNLDMAAYTQGLMDLGSMHCTRSRPACSLCPLRDLCYAQIEARQHELPSAKPKKKNDERQCKMLIVQSRRCVLLERQPSPGIWGGLWSLPRYDDIQALQSACLSWGQSIDQAHKAATLPHTFSHFKLYIEPWFLSCTTPIVAQPGPAQSWVPINQLARTALPAPIRKLLTELVHSPG